jgi:hypothetical protein
VKLIDDIQEKLVRRHFYRSPDEAVFFTDSHGNAMDKAGRPLFYREGALWYVGSRHQVGIIKRSFFYVVLMSLLFPAVFLMSKSQDPFLWGVGFFATVISLLIFMFFSARREQASDMSQGRLFRKISYTEFRRKFFGYNSSVRAMSFGGFFALIVSCIFMLTGFILSSGVTRYLLVVLFLASVACLVIALYSLAIKKAWEHYRARHGIAADAFIRPTEEATEQKSDERKPQQ